MYSNETLKNCEVCRNIKCTCPRKIGGVIPLPLPTETMEERFREKFPQFEGSGTPFPIFKDNPNYNHILKFIQSELSLSQNRIVGEVLEALQKKARQVDYADRTEYDVAYDFLSELYNIKLISKKDN